MVKRLLHTRYRVAELDRTVSFYKDVLGTGGNTPVKVAARFDSGVLQGPGQR
jgi:catechol 2,3-dioxygenase-like lactoylglutathione lyase family enzyme